MNRFRRYDLIDHSPFHSFEKSSIFTHQNTMLNPYFPLIEDEFDLLNLTPTPFDEFNTITDLIQIHEPTFLNPSRRVTRRVGFGSNYHLQSLCDRVSDLELHESPFLSRRVTRRVGFGSDYHIQALCDRVSDLELLRDERIRHKRIGDRKYKWSAEVKDGKGYKLTAEMKGKGGDYHYPIERKYKLKVVDDSDSGSDSDDEKKKKKKKKKKEKGKGKLIEDPSDHRAFALRQRAERKKGKKKEFSPQNAAALIQTSFRSHLHRRSQTLRVIRELTIAKTKLREIRAMFNNFSYRHRLARDGEERQRFSEKIIVLLLTVDAIEGSDLVTRAAKKSMTHELESMLDVIDPQHSGKSMSMRRRTFDMPDGMTNKELAAGVAQVVQMLDQEPTSSESLEACL